MRVAPEAVTVRACLDTEAWSYRFICPKCHLRTIGACAAEPLMAALNAGAAFESWSLPAELDERPAGPALNVVDVLEFHLLLLEPDWFARVGS
jgi:hypothetical protein